MSKIDTYSNMGQKYHVQDQRLQVSNMDDLQVLIHDWKALWIFARVPKKIV